MFGFALSNLIALVGINLISRGEYVMNEEEKQKINDEINEVLESRIEFINSHYLSVRSPLQNFYEWPELDPLRHEICICIMLGLCQAAITLTNHLLESLLKNALIIHKGNEMKQADPKLISKPVAYIIDKYSDGFEKYNDANLYTTINRACTVGLISKNEKKQLHEYRVRFRNAFSHSDKDKTFGSTTIPVMGIRLEEGRIVQDEKGTPELAKFLPGQGYAQTLKAQGDAPEYFLHIDKLVRSIWGKLCDS